jgi:hypothetical protein
VHEGEENRKQNVVKKPKGKDHLEMMRTGFISRRIRSVAGFANAEMKFGFHKKQEFLELSGSQE